MWKASYAWTIFRDCHPGCLITPKNGCLGEPFGMHVSSCSARTWGGSQPGCRSLTWSKFGERCLWKSYMINQRTLDFRWFFSIFLGTRLDGLGMFRWNYRWFFRVVCFKEFPSHSPGPIRAAMMNLRLSPCSHVSTEPHGTPRNGAVSQNLPPHGTCSSSSIDAGGHTGRWMFHGCWGDWDVQGTNDQGVAFCSNRLLNFAFFCLFSKMLIEL